MSSAPKQARALIKRRSLIDAGVALFSKEPYENVTAKSIADEAGVATGTFYQNFSNKNDLLRVIASERMQRVEAALGHLELQLVDPAESELAIESRFLSVLQFIYNFHLESPFLHQVLEQRRAVDAELEAILLDGQLVLQARVKLFVCSFQIPEADVVTANLYAMAEGLVHAIIFGSGHTSVKPEHALHIGAQMLASYFHQHLSTN